MKLLAIGDTHIPRRASKIPDEIRSYVESEEFEMILCTGDLTDRRVLDYLENLADVRVVRGNMDHLPLPEREIIEAGKLRIGLIHGDQVYPRGNREQLKEIAMRLGVDLLVSGHTHSPDVYFGGPILLNPGSATGAWGGGGGTLKPSFIVIEGEKEIQVSLFELDKELQKRNYRLKI
jgi:hypothetical protein